jgi:hypothetical protein
LAAGANVLMPNFTPAPYRRQYEIYPNKRCISEDLGACPACMEHMVAGIGRWVDYSRGDSLKESLKCEAESLKCETEGLETLHFKLETTEKGEIDDGEKGADD